MVSFFSLCTWSGAVRDANHTLDNRVKNLHSLGLLNKCREIRVAVVDATAQESCQPRRARFMSPRRANEKEGGRGEGEVVSIYKKGKIEKKKKMSELAK